MFILIIIGRFSTALETHVEIEKKVQTLAINILTSTDPSQRQ